jgi:hypothetical protein
LSRLIFYTGIAISGRFDPPPADLPWAGYYSIIENLVLWARSEITGFAMNECPGIMEYWNTEILGLAE